MLQLAGVFLFYTLSMLSVIPVFWLHATSGVRDSFWSLQRFSQRPHTMYPNWMRRLLLSFLPFAFIASMPVTALFEGPSAQLVLHTGAVVGTAFALMLWAWRRGLRAYASASS